jgi:putative endonuclease
MPALMFWVYLLQNPSGRFYIGHTDDLEHRLYSHNRTDKVVGKYTRKNGPWTLVWSEVYSNRAEAMARERQIKTWKSSRMIRSRLLGQPE